MFLLLKGRKTKGRRTPSHQSCRHHFLFSRGSESVPRILLRLLSSGTQVEVSGPFYRLFYKPCDRKGVRIGKMRRHFQGFWLAVVYIPSAHIWLTRISYMTKPKIRVGRSPGKQLITWQWVRMNESFYEREEEWNYGHPWQCKSNKDSSSKLCLPHFLPHSTRWRCNAKPAQAVDNSSYLGKPSKVHISYSSI